MWENTTGLSSHSWKPQKPVQNLIRSYIKKISLMKWPNNGSVKHHPRLVYRYSTLIKIHKPTPVGTPIISGCNGPTEKLSCFVDKIFQPIAHQQKSYLKDTTDLINFIEKTKLPKGVILVSMDLTSLCTNIPQEKGINIVCTGYETFYNETPLIPRRLLGKAQRLILQENSFQFSWSKSKSKS